MRFRSQLLLLFLGLFLVVETATFIATSVVSERNARERVAESLAVAGDTLARLMADRERHLFDTGRQLAGDFAFKATFATGERDTILSMLANHGSRIDADAMALISVDELVIADTLRAHAVDEPFGHPWLIDRALDHPEGLAAGVLYVQGRPLEYIVLPLFTPHHAAWLAIGFRLDDRFVAPLKPLTRAEVSLVTPGDGSVHASTLTGPARIALENALSGPFADGTFELEVADRDRVRDLLGMVVPPAIADDLLKREIPLGGERREVTVLFADCLGGASLADAPDLPSALDRLNETLTLLTDVVHRHGGVVDRYAAGGVLALFGAPLAHGDDARRAVACALDIVALDRQVGIGIDTGPVVAGNIGSTRRLAYTVVGAPAQLAPRIAALTSSHGVNVLVTDATRAACGDAYAFVPAGRLHLKGRGEPVALHEPAAR